ncbi:MAG: DUF481 domain-containing protein [Campylobacterota bacterium]
MSVRTVLLFLVISAVLKAEPDSTIQEYSRSADINSTLDRLQGYASVTAAGVLQSEPEAVDVDVTKEDDNNSNLISAATKLDDVSSLDIVKEQRKQRKEAKEEPDKSRRLVDTIVVKGSVLQGKIAQLTSEYISFSLIYGEGSIRIDYTDVESLMTEHEYNIYFDGKETQGYITGIQDHAFIKIRHGEIEELITISKIDRFVISENEDTSLENRIRNTFPYWSGNMDLGVEYESGSNVKHKLKIGGHAERKYTVHKTIFDITYSYEATKTVDTEAVLNKHELYSFLEENYFLTENDLVFAEIGYDFDVPRYVDNRLYPALGYGYRVQAEKKRWVQFKVGVGYVYENFIADDSNLSYDLDNSYAAGLFAVDAEYEVRDLILLNRILFGANFFYMPGMEDLRNNWLLRYSLSATVPFSKAVSLKIIGRQVSDNNPSPSVGNNKVTLDIYLSLRF